MREQRVVDNRVFLLGLDQLYRQAIRWHERMELLECAHAVAETLGIEPADVPVEGYYADDELLTLYFRLMRALQGVDESRTPEVERLPEFQRLCEVCSAPLYGRPVQLGRLLPVGRDPLAQALIDTWPDWSIDKLTAAAHATARKTDDFSLVGLAAYLRDPVVLAGLRETVVLYADEYLGMGDLEEEQPEFIWNVDPELAEQANRFIRTYNELFGEALPPAEPARAERYWNAADDNEIYGRCVKLGSNDAVTPVLHYHWAIYGPEEPAVQEFWHEDVWTTERYREALQQGRPPEL